MIRPWLILSLIIMATLLKATGTLACTCGIDRPPKVELEHADAVFSGTVIEIKISSSFIKAHIQVDRIWKGPVDSTMIITTAPDDGGCGYKFTKGKSYLDYGGYSESPKGLEFWTNSCTRTRPIENAQEDLAELGVGKKEPVDAALEKDAVLNIPILHGSANDDLAAFLSCRRDSFRVGEPLPFSYGILHIGPGIETDNSIAPIRVWWFTTGPVDRENVTWLEVTAPDGKNIPYHGSVPAWKNLSKAVAENSLLLHYKQFVGNIRNDIYGFDMSKPGLYKIRWGYWPSWKGGPWIGRLMSNEVQIEIVK
jgi:hypothetical protein